MGCQSTSLLITAVSSSCQPSPHVNPLFPSGPWENREDGRARMCTPGTSLSSPPFAADPGFEKHPCKPLDQCQIPQALGSASIISLTLRLWGEEIGQEGMGGWMKTEEKTAGLLPTLRGTWMGVGCPQLACFPRCCSGGHDPRMHEPLVGPMTDAPWG